MKINKDVDLATILWIIFFIGMCIYIYGLLREYSGQDAQYWPIYNNPG